MSLCTPVTMRDADLDPTYFQPLGPPKRAPAALTPAQHDEWVRGNDYRHFEQRDHDPRGRRIEGCLHDATRKSLAAVKGGNPSAAFPAGFPSADAAALSTAKTKQQAASAYLAANPPAISAEYRQKCTGEGVRILAAHTAKLIRVEWRGVPYFPEPDVQRSTWMRESAGEYQASLDAGVDIDQDLLDLFGVPRGGTFPTGWLPAYCHIQKAERTRHIATRTSNAQKQPAKTIWSESKLQAKIDASLAKHAKDWQLKALHEAGEKPLMGGREMMNSAAADWAALEKASAKRKPVAVLKEWDKQGNQWEFMPSLNQYVKLTADGSRTGAVKTAAAFDAIRASEAVRSNPVFKQIMFDAQKEMDKWVNDIIGGHVPAIYSGNNQSKDAVTITEEKAQAALDQYKQNVNQDYPTPWVGV